MKPLSNKTVVITGSGGGLGAAYARHVASLGAAVVVNDINPLAAERTAAEIRSAGGRAISLVGDVSDWNFAATLVRSCVEAFGSITGFVNNAGVLRHGPIEDLKADDLRRMVEINILGTAAGTQAAVKEMLSAGVAGTVINVASGSQAGDIALGGYGGTKAAIASMTFSWAMELRDTPIRINAISPLAETAMAAQNAGFMAVQAANREVHYSSLPPAENNAPLVAYLLSDDSRSVHGQVIRIAGQQLSFVTHPLIAAPVLSGDWDFGSIRDAFATTLNHCQQPLGLGFAAAAPTTDA
ncbi:MAG TPA: SDR family oxidoreductase [Ensifer sp.]|nr:SDR family oxidoreductase [Ensifer sp.]